jgi:hypothetical protein
MDRIDRISRIYRMKFFFSRTNKPVCPENPVILSISSPGIPAWK